MTKASEIRRVIFSLPREAEIYRYTVVTNISTDFCVCAHACVRVCIRHIMWLGPKGISKVLNVSNTFDFTYRTSLTSRIVHGALENVKKRELPSTKQDPRQ